MKRCPKCGRTYQDDAKFCMHCGVDLEVVLDVKEESDDDRERFEAQERARAAEKAEDEMYEAWSDETVAGGAFEHENTAEQETASAGNAADNGAWHEAGTNAQQGWQQAGTNASAGWQQAPGSGQQNDGAAPFGRGAAENYGFQSEGQHESDPASGFYQGGPVPQNTWQEPPRYIKKRGIVACVLLSIFTFGIYYLYWMACLADDLNAVVKSRNGSDTSGIAVVLLTIITCGIYGLYWMYKAGEKCDWLCGEQNGYRHILYLVIGLFGFGIVSLALMQDTLNVRLHG